MEKTHIQIMIGKAEKKLIEKYANRVGLGVAPYIRSLVLGQILDYEKKQVKSQ